MSVEDERVDNEKAAEEPMSPQMAVMSNLGKEIMAHIPGSYVATAEMQQAVRRASLSGEAAKSGVEDSTAAVTAITEDTSNVPTVSKENSIDTPPPSARVSPRMSFILESNADAMVSHFVSLWLCVTPSLMSLLLRIYSRYYHYFHPDCLIVTVS